MTCGRPLYVTMTKKKSKANKQARVAEKKKKQEKKGDRKAKLKAAKAQESEEEPDLDDILQEYKRQQEAFHKVTETILDDPPRARTAGSFIASPSNKNELLLFGGEYFNGSTVTFFGDLLIYHLGRDEWRSVTSPNAPLPRSGHAWCRGGNQSGYIFLFGGEFSSPKQGTFYHYNDFWCLQASSREWTRLEPKGPIPPARSGHRMTFFKQVGRTLRFYGSACILNPRKKNLVLTSTLSCSVDFKTHPTRLNISPVSQAKLWTSQKCFQTFISLTK